MPNSFVFKISSPALLFSKFDQVKIFPSSLIHVSNQRDLTMPHSFSKKKKRSSSSSFQKKLRFPKIMHPFLNQGHSAMPHPLKKKNIFLKYQGFKKSCINSQTRGIRPCLIHFQKKKKAKQNKNHHRHLFIKNKKFKKSCIHF